MASIKMGPLVADIRGQVGGTCFSRGSGGAIARNSPKPCNPRSTAQNARRSVFSRLARHWSAELSDAERTGWNDYAAGCTWTNKVGTAATISGMAAFVRLNSLLLLIGEAIQEAAPIVLGHAGTPSFTILADGADLSINISEPGEPFDKDTDGSRMVYFVHGPTNAGRSSLSGQRRYLGSVEGDSVAAPTFPDEHTSPITFSNGQIVSVTGVFIDPNGRIGGEYVAQILAATP